FNESPTTEIYTLSLHDALPISGRFDDAITSYKEAARVQPNEPEAYYNLGLAYLEKGDRESAMVQARRLESIDAELNKKLLAELRSEEHTSELQSRGHLVCRLLL